jgi:hypothetical protein
MPTISKTSGTAIINTGFITLLFQALTSLGLLEEEGSEPGDAFRCRTGTEVDATSKPLNLVARPATSCAPLQPLGVKVTIPGGNCCLIVNNVEKIIVRLRLNHVEYSRIPEFGSFSFELSSFELLTIEPLNETFEPTDQAAVY